MDIDDVVYPLLVASFPDNEPGEILDVVEEFKQPRGLDEPSEFEQEVWQKYLVLKRTLKREMAGGSKAEASQPRSGGGEGEAAQ
jgi:hypothetical protein